MLKQNNQTSMSINTKENKQSTGQQQKHEKPLVLFSPLHEVSTNQR